MVCLICTPSAIEPATLGPQGAHIRQTTNTHVTYTKCVGPSIAVAMGLPKNLHQIQLKLHFTSLKFTFSSYIVKHNEIDCGFLFHIVRYNGIDCGL